MKAHVKSFYQKISDGHALGTWCLLQDPSVIEILGLYGLDFVVIDFEHGAHSVDALTNMIRAANVSKTVSLVRSPGINESAILRILDCNPDGIMIPNVKTKKEVFDIISYVYYPPVGTRGHSPFTRAGNYTQIGAAERMEKLNKELIVGILIEGMEIMCDLEEILSNYGALIDILYIGIYDLAKSVGTPGIIDSQPVIKAVKSIQEVANNFDVSLGMLANDQPSILQAKRQNARFICYQNDTGILAEATRNLKSHFDSH